MRWDGDRAAGALWDDGGEYRYLLWRSWGERPPARFVLLNPSSADAISDDPTVRRCVAFARRWGCGGVLVANLFALRATRPAGLSCAVDPVGPANDQVLYQVALSGPVIAAWGNHGRTGTRSAAAWELLSALAEIRIFGWTKMGEPRHPLYLPANAPLEKVTLCRRLGSPTIRR